MDNGHGFSEQKSNDRMTSQLNQRSCCFCFGFSTEIKKLRTNFTPFGVNQLVSFISMQFRFISWNFNWGPNEPKLSNSSK